MMYNAGFDPNRTSEEAIVKSFSVVAVAQRVLIRRNFCFVKFDRWLFVPQNISYITAQPSLLIAVIYFRFDVNYAVVPNVTLHRKIEEL